MKNEGNVKTASKSWFVVLNNPEIDFPDSSPQEIVQKAQQLWCSESDSRTCLVAYCISSPGTEKELLHLHMVLCDEITMRFSKVKQIFPRAHIEPTTGTKAEAEDYIYKRGKWQDKAENEDVVCVSQHGEIKGGQGSRNDLKLVHDMLEEGYTPEQIFEINFRYRKYEKMIRDEYFHKKMKDTPLLRDVKVIWHIGDSGSGKSYSSLKLAEKYGRENIYIVNNYESGAFDKYNGQDILFLDEFKGGFSYQTLLTILDRYTIQVHCRYSNVYMLWKEVHITSVFPPETIYKMLVNENNNYDTYEQLKRRINEIHYHYKEDGDFKMKIIDINDYKDYEDLKDSMKKSDFETIGEEGLPYFSTTAVPYEQLYMDL